MTIAINCGETHGQTERLGFEDKTEEELLQDRRKLRESINRCVEASLQDGRADIENTPIVSQEEKYRRQYREVTERLIDMGAI